MVPLFKPYMPEKLPELNNVLYSGALSYGKWGKQFEQYVSQYIGNEKFCVVNSFSSSISIALQVLGILRGDHIIASPVGCLASYQPLAVYGVKIVWADVDPLNGAICPDSVKSRITNKTKAILHNHYCGYPGYISEINSLAREEGLLVIEDAIESFGSEYAGKKIGNTGADATVFSFQAVRLPNLIEGGGVSFNCKDFYKKALHVRDYSIDRSMFRDSFGEINPECDITEPGYGALINEVNSYIGCQQMKSVPSLLNKQRANAKNWDSTIINSCRNMKVVNNYINSSSLPNYWVYGILSEDKYNTMMEFRNKGYWASGVHINNNLYSIFGGKKSLLGVNDFISKFLAIPSGWWVDLEINNYE